MSGQSGNESRSSRRRFVKKSETLDDEVLLGPGIGAPPPVDEFTGGCLLLVLGASLADLARARRDIDWLDAIVVAWLSGHRTVLP